MSDPRKQDSDSEVEVVSHPAAEWNHWRTESSRGQLLRDLIENGMEEDRARKHVDKDFANRGYKRRARTPPPHSPDPSRASSPVRPKPSTRKSKISSSPSPTINPPPSSRIGRTKSPRPERARSPAPYASSISMTERVEPRPKKNHHSSHRDNRRRHSPSSVRHYSPPPRAQCSPSPRRSHYHRSPSPRQRRSPSPAAKPASPDPVEQWRQDVEKEREYEEQQAAARGFDPAYTKQKLDEKYKFAKDPHTSRTRSPSFGSGGGGGGLPGHQQNGSGPSNPPGGTGGGVQPSAFDSQLTKQEQYWAKYGYTIPQPGTDFETRLDAVQDWLEDNPRKLQQYGPGPRMGPLFAGTGAGGPGGPRQYGPGPSIGNPYAGLRGRAPINQQFHPGPSMGSPYAFGMGGGIPQPRTPQITQILQDIKKEVLAEMKADERSKEIYEQLAEIKASVKKPRDWVHSNSDSD